MPDDVPPGGGLPSVAAGDARRAGAARAALRRGVGEQRAPPALHAEVRHERLGRVALERAAAGLARRVAIEAGGAQVLAALDLELVTQAIGATQAGRGLAADPGLLGGARAAAPHHEVAAQAFELAVETGRHPARAHAH